MFMVKGVHDAQAKLLKSTSYSPGRTQARSNDGNNIIKSSDVLEHIVGVEESAVLSQVYFW